MAENSNAEFLTVAALTVPITQARSTFAKLPQASLNFIQHSQAEPPAKN